jgi:hypothetical protein
MNAEPTEPEIDRALRPKGDHLLPTLYTELQTLQRVAGRARAVLRRYIPPAGSTP